MNYKYSICHPEKQEIEYPEKELNRYEVIEMIEYYAWLDILNEMEKLPQGKVFYSPSLGFSNEADKKSLDLSATLENGKPEFSLWYNREVKRRPLFGLLSEKTEMSVIDKWDFSLEKALEYFKIFLDRDYIKLEKLMNEK